MTPFMIKLGTTAAALAAGGGFAVLSPSSQAAAFYSPPLFLDVTVGSPANLVARGAAVSVPITVTCNADGGAYLSVQVSEKVGKKIATGQTNTNVACSGGHETLLVTVPAGSGQAFAKGSAYGSAYISGCKFISTNYTCGQETGSATIRIK
ncbi:MAG: hypothetical protein ABI140_10040 [Jatrophihabitantaceae bacterium]